MYLGTGITKITNGSLTIEREATVEYKHKKKVDSYEDINNNPREDSLGYEMTFNFTFVFKEADTGSGDQTKLRRLLNSSADITVTPRNDETSNAYTCFLKLKKDEQFKHYDIMEVEAQVTTLQDIPYKTV